MTIGPSFALATGHEGSTMLGGHIATWQTSCQPLISRLWLKPMVAVEVGVRLSDGARLD